MNTPQRPGLMDSTCNSPTPPGRLSSAKAKRSRTVSSPSSSRGTGSRSQSLAQPSPTVTPAAELRLPEYDTDATMNGEASSEPPDDYPTPPIPTPPSSAARKSSATRRDSREPTDSWRVDLKLELELKETPKTGSTRSTKGGYNYVYGITRADGSSIIKIGTALDSESRMKTIAGKCRHEKMETLNFSQRPIYEFRRAEKLILLELHNFRYQFDCTCRTGHTEYFMVDKTVALEVTQRWTAFCRANPWDKEGTLHPFWMVRLENRLLCDTSEKREEHEPRAERWGEFINATDWEFLSFNAASILRDIWPWRWHWASFFQALWLAFVTFPDPVSAACLAALVIWSLGERDLLGTPIIWATPQGPRRKLKRSLKRTAKDVLAGMMNMLSDDECLDAEEQNATTNHEEREERREVQEMEEVRDIFIAVTPTGRRTQSA